MPSPLAPTPEPDSAEPLFLDLLRAEIAEGWTLYHAAEFVQLTWSLPEIIDDARIAVAVGPRDQREAAQVALGKALTAMPCATVDMTSHAGQLGAIRMLIVGRDRV